MHRFSLRCLSVSKCAAYLLDAKIQACAAKWEIKKLLSPKRLLTPKIFWCLRGLAKTHLPYLKAPTLPLPPSLLALFTECRQEVGNGMEGNAEDMKAVG